jgi:glycosyltransferase involved in cell wall biosynthesis
LTTKPPSISVVIPSFNCAAYLEESVNSVLSQSLQNFEIIIVNDGSTDSTLEVANHLAQNDSRIKVLSHKNSKQGKTRNAGVAEAKGTYIAFLDGDDIWLPHKLEIQLSVLQQQDVDLVFSDGFICLNNDLNSREHTFQITQKVFDHNDLELFYRQNQVPTSTVLCTKAAFEKAGGFDEEAEVQNCEDYLLWVRMIDNGVRLYGLDENLILYRVHPSSSTAHRINQLRPLTYALMRLNGPLTEERIQRIRKTLKDFLTELNAQKQTLSMAFDVVSEYYRTVKKSVLYQLIHSLSKLFPVRIYLWINWRLI